MGRILLVCRLAARHLRRRRAEAAMLLIAIMAATTTLTLGLLMYAMTGHPYDSTRAATAGPDVVASVFPPQPIGGPRADLAALTRLAHAPGVTGHSGPYPVTWAISLLITVATVVTVLMVHTHNLQVDGHSALANPQTDKLNAVLAVITVVLVALAAVNVIFITWVTALDARRPSALARALGATPDQVAAGLSVAQLLPALPAALLGIPAGIGLYGLVDHGRTTIFPPLWLLIAVLLGTLVVVAGLTAIPARVGARRPAAEILQSELA